MAYGDYLDAAAMLDSCDADLSAPTGKGANCRFVAQAEEATTAAVNRASLAIAQNSDELKARLDAATAITQVTNLTGFSGGTITIDPTGGGSGDIKFTGTLYLGNGDYSADQESRDTLFQLLDSESNEVLVDGAEVKISNTSVAPGSGFYSAGVVTLTLSATLPSGNYKLAYAIGATLATLPDDALIRADIRGLHEAAGESQRIHSYVCAIDTSEGPADYVGASAVADAIADLKSSLSLGGVTIYIREGTYTAPTTWPGAGDDYRMVGVGARASVVLSLGANLQIDGANCVFENLTFSIGTGFHLGILGTWMLLRNCVMEVPAPNGTEYVELRTTYGRLDGCSIGGCDLVPWGSSAITVDRCTILGYGRALDLRKARRFYMRDCNIVSSESATPNGLVEFTNGTSDAAQDVVIEKTNLTCTGFPVLYVAGYNDANRATGIVVRDCLITGDDHAALQLYQEFVEDTRFERCTFVRQGVGTAAGVLIDGTSALSKSRAVFESCSFVNEVAGALAVSATNDPKGVSFLSCHFAASGGAKTAGFVNLDHDQTARGVIRGCSFYPYRVTGGTADVLITGYDGGDIDIYYPATGYAYDGATPSLQLQYCNLDTVNVDLGGVQSTTLTGTAAVYLYNGARVSNLHVKNMRGTWEMPLIMVGSANLDHRAILDGLTVSPFATGLWKNSNDEALVVELSDRSVLRRFVWSPGTNDVTTGNAYVVHTEAANIVNVLVEHCDVNIGSVPTNFDGVFRLGKSGSDLDDLRFLNNIVVGGTLSASCTNTVIVLASGPLIEGNVIHHGLMVGTGETTTSTALFLGNPCNRARVVSNEIGGYIPGTPANGARKVLYLSNTATVGGIIGRALLVHNNIFRDLDQNVQAYIGDPVGLHPSGGVFAGHVDDTNHFMSA